MTAARVMIVEDEPIVALNLQTRLQRLGYRVTGMAASCAEAVELVKGTPPDVCLMDIRIDGDIDGIDTARYLNRIRLVPIVYLTAHSEDSTLDRARSTHPYGYLLKPFSEREVHATIQMALAHRAAEVALEVREKQLEMALSAARLAVLDLDERTDELRPRGDLEEILGVSLPHAPRLEDLLAQVEEGDRERVRSELERCLRNLDAFHIEFRAARDREPAWFEVKGMAKEAAHGHRRAIGILSNVTEARTAVERARAQEQALERKVSERTEQLDAALDDLRTFNRSIAHDLNGPLRAVRGLCEILIEEHGQAMTADMRSLIDRVHRAGIHMGEMLEGLHSLAHLSQTGIGRSDVDISSEAESIARHLAESDPARTVRISVQPGLRASADLGMVRVLLENLLRNAWKFTSRTPGAVIEVRGVRVGKEDAWFVRDNGAGFDMLHAAKLFRPFQRVHSSREFPGTGIGLATVGRIATRHGGRAWIESEPGRGTTVWFTLGPAQPQGPSP